MSTGPIKSKFRFAIFAASVGIAVLIGYIVVEKLGATQRERASEEKEATSWRENARSNSAQPKSPPTTALATTTTPSATSTFMVPSPFTLALDIGHTPKRGGAVSARGVSEYEFNRRLVDELKQKLRFSRDIQSFVVNSQGSEISLPKRAEQADQGKADVFLAIHHDSVKESYLKKWEVEGQTRKYCDEYSGYSIFVSAKNTKAMESLAVAKVLGESLLKAGFKPTLHHAAQENRIVLDTEKGIYLFDDLIVLKGAKMPAVLLECGVIVNRDEEQKLNNPQYRNRLIEAIIGGMESLAAPKR
jgi:N-acetylmuramoyl-L-alanine amidase